ncbi:MAG: hypothetical protein ACLGGX_08790 [Bdellovibrionia bacterium]
MLTNKSKFLAFLALIFISVPSLAQVQFSLSLLKYDQETSGSTLGNVDSTTTIYNLKLGSQLSNNLYVGGIYDHHNVEVNSSDEKRTSLGVTAGYHSGSWFLDASYFLTSQIAFDGGATVKDGSGFGLDFGYTTSGSGSLFFGLQLSYKAFNYKKVDDTSTNNSIESELYPMFNVGVKF